MDGVFSFHIFDAIDSEQKAIHDFHSFIITYHIANANFTAKRKNK